MKQAKVVARVDWKTNQVHLYIDNGLFLDGRRKTLKKHGLTDWTETRLEVQTKKVPMSVAEREKRRVEIMERRLEKAAKGCESMFTYVDSGNSQLKNSGRDASF